MNNIKFELDKEGVRNLLKSPEMQGILQSYATQTQSHAGAGYESEVHIGKNRAYANIYPATYYAVQDNLDNNTLLLSLR